MARKQTLLFMMWMPAARHPIVHMYMNALGPNYDFAIASTDPEAAAATFPNVKCLQVVPNYSLRSLLGLSPKPSELSTAPSPEPSGDMKPETSAEKRVDLHLLFYHLHTTRWRVFKYLRQVKPAAVIAIDGELLPTARLFATFLRIPYFYVVCEIFPYQYSWYTKGLSRTLSLIEMYGARGATKVLVPDISHVKLLARRYGIDRSRFVEIGTCPDVPQQSAIGKVHSPLRIYYHGRYTPGRGVKNLILAMSQTSGAHLYMRLVGEVEVLRTLTRENDLENKVTFLEPVAVDKLAEASTEFDVGVVMACPTNGNGRFMVSYKFFEYMAAGLSAMCPNSHFLGPFLKRHRIGINYVNCNPDGIAAAIRQCVESPGRVELWKKEARSLAEREFNAEIQGTRLRKVIQACLSK
jgi:glycosyltransferase involved in cell wall biosynthesis